uniref:hypothetical protein n=1 Tax=Massilia sp. DWR3-1-1 TaxID=2804559 RepID=UPI003CF8AE1B
GTVSLAASGNSLGAMTINAGTGAPASADSASEIRQQNAVASTLSVQDTAATPAMALAVAPAAAPSLSLVPSGNSAVVMLAGLNVTLVADGVRLPQGVQAEDSSEERKQK